MNNKKQQHYIWKHYLSPWLTENKLWCHRNGKIFFSSRDNIGQKRFFYRAEPLNDFERLMIKDFIKSMHPSSHAASLSTLAVYDAASHGDEHTKKNALEDYHTAIEHTAIPIVEVLLDEDMSWLNNEDEKIKFARFLGVQYSRTNRVHEALAASLGLAEEPFPKYKGQFDVKKISKVYALLMGDVIGNWVYSAGHFSLLKNTTELEFIVGDQPVYNLDMKGRDVGELATTFNLYYPVSPNLALLVTSEPRVTKVLNLNEVNKYNEFIIFCSHEQLYSKNEDSLKRYKLSSIVC